MADHVVLTGATGFLGRELFERLYDESPEHHITLLVRGRDDAQVQARAERLLGSRAHAARIEILRADLTLDRFGLSAPAYDRLVRTTSHVIHGAASVDFSLALDRARAINVEGTRRVLDLAAAAKARLDYIGTAFVAGRRTGTIGEDELDVGQRFRNNYERTKLEAEAHVRERWGDQPIAVHRPTVIVGDSATGRTSTFKVIYWPMKIYARGIWRIGPGRRDLAVDIVPSDFVARAILHLRTCPSALGRAFHLAAGPAGTITLGEAADLAAAFFGRKPPIFFDPRLFALLVRPLVRLFVWGRTRRVLARARVYTPYFSDTHPLFDTTNARAELAPAGITPPPIRGYLTRLFEYARDTDFGRRDARDPPDISVDTGGR
jgi:long-chain acyl-CoA synthetase